MTNKYNSTTKRKRLPPSLSKEAKTLMVSKVTLQLERNGIITKHELYFDKEPLSVKEMYNNGFLGDIEFHHAGGLIEKAEIEAGPKGEFEGTVHGAFVFKVRMLSPHAQYQPKVVKFNYNVYTKC